MIEFLDIEVYRNKQLWYQNNPLISELQHIKFILHYLKHELL